MRLKDLIEYGKIQLGDEFEDANIIIKLLIESILKIKREQIIILSDEIISSEKVTEFKAGIDKVKSGIPVQYLVGNQEFMKLNFYVDQNVLIPQPDTEILVQEVIKDYKDKECKILDLCTGSGAIGISLAKYIEKSNVVATDISMKALQVAKLNAEKNMVHKKMIFIESDMFENILDSDFDIIVSNPPYIKTDVIGTLSKQVQNEPIIALDGGQDGLSFYRKIVDNAYKHMKKGGKIYLEIGYDQKEEVMKLLYKNKNYKDTYVLKDLEMNNRVIVSKSEG